MHIRKSHLEVVALLGYPLHHTWGEGGHNRRSRKGIKDNFRDNDEGVATSGSQSHITTGMHLRHWNKEALTIHRHHLTHSTHLCHAYANKRNKVLATKKVAINTIWSVSTYRFSWITQIKIPTMVNDKQRA